MARDRYERKHRRTHRNPGCMAVMAGADFVAAPSLCEAMGLSFPELTPEENATIDRARAAGYAVYFPAFPSAADQARKTLAGATSYLEARR